MDGGTSVALAAIGLVSAILALVVKPLFGLLRDNTEVSRLQASAILSQNESINAQTEEIAKGNREAEKRNGHLAEITVQSRDQVLESFQRIQNQHVVHQHIDEATVSEETVTNETITHKGK